MPVKAFLYNTVLLALSILIIGCGSKRNPMGGPEDLEKPTLLASAPAEFGNISSGIIEISLSKPMDKSSLTNSVYIYPPVSNKKISLEGSTMKLKLNEALNPEINYFITLTTRLKDIRGNALDRNQTLIFHTGELSKYRIAGTISYEDKSDMGLPIELSLFSPDSLLVLSDRITGGAYALDNLNPQAHILRAYIDKNKNNRYDFGFDPFFEGISTNQKVANLNINLAYADSTKPTIKQVIPVSTSELQLRFSEALSSYESINISGRQSLSIQHKVLEKDMLTLLCTEIDSTECQIQVLGAKDIKGNISDKLEIKLRVKAPPDTLSPKITYTNPRNGASVNSLQPVIEIHFSEIIPAGNIQVKLISGSEEIPLKQLSTTGRIHRFQPGKELVNYRSHTLTVLTTTMDFSGNKLESDYQLQFLPLKRN